MATFAVLGGNKVVNTIVADTIEDAELVSGATCVEFTTDNVAGIGYSYDSETGIFTADEEAISVVAEGDNANA